MPYVTNWERRGRQEGRQEGRQQGRREALHETILRNLAADHGEIPAEISERILKIIDPDRLHALQRASVLSTSLDAFRQKLDD